MSDLQFTYSEVTDRMPAEDRYAALRLHHDRMVLSFEAERKLTKALLDQKTFELAALKEENARLKADLEASQQTADLLEMGLGQLLCAVEQLND